MDEPTARELTDVLAWLQDWYAARCDGEWEHDYGVTIESLDNPGWQLRIDLTGTPLAEQRLDRTVVQRHEDDWLHAWTEAEVFHAACGPLNLAEALHTFRRWSDSPGPTAPH